MRRILAGGGLVALVLVLQTGFAGAGGDKAAKEALQQLNDYIGGWKGNGLSEKNKSEIWKEAMNWSWRFKGKDVWLSLEFTQSKKLKSGEVRYLPDKERYQLTVVDLQDKKHVLEGELKKGRLTFEGVNPETKETEQVQLNLAGGGVRYVYTFSYRPAGRKGLFTRDYKIDFTKEGESFGTAAKKVECIVTGGLGTMPVNYKGVT